MQELLRVQLVTRVLTIDETYPRSLQEFLKLRMKYADDSWAGGVLDKGKTKNHQNPFKEIEETLMPFENASSFIPISQLGFKCGWKALEHLICDMRRGSKGTIEEETRVSWVRHRDIHILTAGAYTYTSDQRFQALHRQNTGQNSEWSEWTLCIKWAQERDQGLYECQISTIPVKSHQFRLNVVIPTATILGGPDLYVGAGSTINLTCAIHFSSEPPAYIFWYYNEHVLSYDSPRGGVSVITEKGGDVTTSWLLIQTAQPSDSGEYSCKPSNANTASIKVHVLNGCRRDIDKLVANSTAKPCPPTSDPSRDTWIKKKYCLINSRTIYTATKESYLLKNIWLSMIHKPRQSSNVNGITEPTDAEFWLGLIDVGGPQSNGSPFARMLETIDINSEDSELSITLEPDAMRRAINEVNIVLKHFQTNRCFECYTQILGEIQKVWRVIEGRMDDTMNGGIVEKKAPISIVKKFIFEMIDTQYADDRTIWSSLISLCVFVTVPDTGYLNVLKIVSMETPVSDNHRWKTRQCFRTKQNGITSSTGADASLHRTSFIFDQTGFFELTLHSRCKKNSKLLVHTLHILYSGFIKKWQNICSGRIHEHILFYVKIEKNQITRCHISDVKLYRDYGFSYKYRFMVENIEEDLKPTSISSKFAALVLAWSALFDGKTEAGGHARSFHHFHGPVIGEAQEISWKDKHGHRDHDYVAHPHYEFSYGVEDHHTGDYHGQKEHRDGKDVVGEYTIKEPGGNIRTMERGENPMKRSNDESGRGRCGSFESSGRKIAYTGLASEHNKGDEHLISIKYLFPTPISEYSQCVKLFQRVASPYSDKDHHVRPGDSYNSDVLRFCTGVNCTYTHTSLLLLDIISSLINKT
ncbi:Cuticle8.6, isoform B [Apis cerana cerana]|uniref:Cuticle8.6, isoform B n=1 Tax=Apis cerana cerana TaxID=94128 RepID=A0A2A3ESB7_APICC|nr:Cuticle8.6, isoform B [Apis cerana cerana]